MNPSTPATPEMHLPAPVGDVLPKAAGAAETAAGRSPENASVAHESQPMQTGGAPISLPISSVQATNSVVNQTASNDATSTTNIAVPLTADDKDLIEKDWIDKAKQIVERTKDDPSQQSKEIGVFKADYLQKRYNKTIKPGE